MKEKLPARRQKKFRAMKEMSRAGCWRREPIDGKKREVQLGKGPSGFGQRGMIRSNGECQG